MLSAIAQALLMAPNVLHSPASQGYHHEQGMLTHQRDKSILGAAAGSVIFPYKGGKQVYQASTYPYCMYTATA